MRRPAKRPSRGLPIQYLSALPALAATLILGASPVYAQSAADRPAIEFKAEIPKAPAEMKVFALKPSRPPVDFLNEALRRSPTPAALTMDAKALVVRDTRFKDDPDIVRAYVDPDSGDAYLTPSMADLVAIPAGRLTTSTALEVARKAFADDRFIPRDGTQLRPGAPITVLGGSDGHAPATPVRNKLTAQTNITAVNPALKTLNTKNLALRRVAPRTVMVLVPATRYADGLPVYGRGSHTVITVASDGSLAGALRRWRTASAGETVKTDISADQVRSDIERQLKGKVPDGAHAIIDRIELAYYDRNADFLQPVYRFEALIAPAQRTEGRKASPIRLEGFVPVVPARETIPDLAATPKGDAPAEAPQPQLPPRAELSPAEDAKLRAAIGGAGTPDDFTLGEYVNQDWHNDGGYVEMSNNFLDGLKSRTTQVNRTQWYVAHEWEVVGPQSRYFMNAVNVAYTVPHGNWLFNTTRQACCDGWYVPNIGTGGNPGFGHAAGGVLATWIIMSCEVIPSFYDRQHEAGGSGNGYTAFDAWWPVFQGLHNAIGFRTIMYYPDDGLQYGFGQDAATGGDINTAWFQEVAASPNGAGTYANDHLTGSPLVHYDRASTMIDARDLGHSIFHISAQTPATTLWNFWMDN